MSVQYEVIGLPNCEHSNKVQSILENKYKSPTKKRVTLNERFGVLEKGYFLHACAPETTSEDFVVQLTINERNLISKSEFVENYLAKNPNPNASSVEEDKEDKENAPRTEKSVEKFAAEAYIRDVANTILKSK